MSKRRRHEIPTPEELVRQAGVSGPAHMLIEFDLDRKVKEAKVQSSKRICATDLKKKSKEYWHRNLIIKRNDSVVLSRLVQCTECDKIHEWSAADEGGRRKCRAPKCHAFLAKVLH